MNDDPTEFTIALPMATVFLADSALIQTRPFAPAVYADGHANLYMS